jgi:N utilization substance protein A
MKSDFMIALTQLAAERHLPREQVLQAIEVALASAFKKDNPASGQNISVKLNPNTGDVRVYALKTVVDLVDDPDREISVGDAQHIKKGADIGDEVAAAEPLPHNASRIAAQTAKQVVLQRLREAERELLYQEFLQFEGDVVSGVIDQTEAGRFITLDLGGRAQAVLPYEEQVATERYRRGQRSKVFVLSVRNASKGPEILVSRSHKDMLKRLFEIEVPEVHNGVVEIKAIAREAGFRSKVAVTATQQGIDPVGSCIGVRGNRIQSIVNELQGEKIDVISWDRDPKVFISKALSPSEVVEVELASSDQSAIVVVPDRQLSLAIGKEGQNTRLAARLTGWRLDIKGMTEWEEIREARRLRKIAEPEPEEVPVLDDDGELAVADGVTVDEADEISELTVADVLEGAGIGTLTEQPVNQAEAVVTPTDATEQLDEEEILAALIREEDEAATGQAVTSDDGISVDELESFTLDNVEVLEEQDLADEEEPAEDGFAELPEMSVLTPDAGKIRFAEDIIEESRGGGRRDRRGRRGGTRARGARQGGR